MDQWMNPDEGEKKGGSSIRVTELGEEDPTVIASVMYTIHPVSYTHLSATCSKFGYIMEYSMYLTLAQKLRSTISKLKKKYRCV